MRFAAAALLFAASVLTAPPIASASAHKRLKSPVTRGSLPGRARAGTGTSLLDPAPGGVTPEEPGSSGRPQADPLVTNGLGSPSCDGPLGVELDAQSRRDCETSGFSAAGAPTGNFGIDVHIDTGLNPLSGGNVLSTIQDVFIAPAWFAVVWLVHALVVMLEWSFGLNLFEGSTSHSVQASLARLSSTLTTPLLGLALAIAGTLVAYHGLIRRRVAQTLGEALATIAMILGGAWLMVDPGGTVGALSSWSGEAGLGTLAASARGAPGRPGRALAESMSAVYAAAIEAPWCYLEFGNVAWCREPARLDQALRASGLRIAAAEMREAGCSASSSRCSGDPGKTALLGSARLLREARTNGDEFLALPPNGPQRNSINDSASLLRVLCGSSDATACKGPGASEAEFRTNSGTWPRVGGLLLIVIGLAGMMLLLGFIALRLLLAAILSVFYLLLTPGVVLLPALGESGRSLFRAWAVRLLGAVVAKLIFAFLLGVVLSVMAVLDGLQGLGWWAQWMLLAAFWWGAFLHRHEILARATRTTGVSHRELRFRRERRSRSDRRDRDRRNRATPEPAPVAAGVGAARARGSGGGGSARGPSPQPRDEQAQRVLAARKALGPVEKRAALTALAGSRAQLGRIKRAKAAAAVAGDRRRAALLAAREARVEAAVAHHAARLARGDSARPSERHRPSSAVLDGEARLPALLEREAGDPRRSYPALVGLVGLSEDGYRDLAPQNQRRARLAIDRELNARREQRGLEAAVSRARQPRPPEGEEESSVMRDARAVAEGRKRELGFDRS